VALPVTKTSPELSTAIAAEEQSAMAGSSKRFVQDCPDPLVASAQTRPRIPNTLLFIFNGKRSHKFPFFKDSCFLIKRK
jgi:hypothetical protein